MTTLLDNIEAGDYRRENILEALGLRGSRQEALFALARRRRDEHFPSRSVQVRSVIEISNICRQGCNFCNIGQRPAGQYTIDKEALIKLVSFLYAQGRRHLMLQSGENGSRKFVDYVESCVRILRERFPDLHIILCLGNLEETQYRQLREAGAESYILKFETSNARLYHELKPRDTLERRLACLESLLRVGFMVGSGDMAGLPGQTLDDLVDDLLLLGKFDLAMQSCTVFIPGEGSKFRHEPMGDLDLTLNMLATMRIMYPHRLMPTTSSLEKPRKGGQYLGLMAGANTVTYHDGTPEELKHLFPIYSLKRFTPQGEHLTQIVHRAGLSLS